MPIEPNSACQPEMAPQAIVTNSMGHSGCMPTAVAPMKPLASCNAKAPAGAVALGSVTNGAMSAPIALTPMTMAVIQKPM